MNNNQNILFQELIQNQRKNILIDKKLNLSDLKRISTYLTKSIFSNECSLWTGYITQFKNDSYYINFYFNGKKVALHRLLYNNFSGDLDDSEYLKYNCENKGKCCNLNHFKRVLPENYSQEIHSDFKDDIIDISSNKLKKNITVKF
jgi:hypothetical protein